MKFINCRWTAIVALLGAILLNINASAQSFVRYVLPTDVGTKALYADTVLTSVVLPWGVSRVDNNAALQEAAEELSRILSENNSKLLKVYVCGSASPDGLWQENVHLSQARTDAASRYLRYVTGVPVDKMHSQSLNEDWDRLYELVEASDIPYKYEVLDIIETKSWGERKTALKNLGGGRVWRILMDSFFPQLRCVRIAIYCQWDPTKPYMSLPRYDSPQVEVDMQPDAREEVQQPIVSTPVVSEEIVLDESSATEKIIQTERKAKSDTIYLRDTVYYFKETVYMTDSAPKQRPVRQKKVYDEPWMMGLKTNLLADAIVVPTLGLELQLSKKLSLDLEGFYTGYNIFNKQDENTNVYGFSPELRLWTSGKTMQKGHFVGLHARCVWYTFQWTDGFLYQNGPENVWDGNYHDSGNNTPAWSAGFTYGYSLGFGKKGNWGLEFILGVGYANYSQNLAVYQNNIWELSEHQSATYFGITRASVNLTYRFSLRNVASEN